jgi:hypothetical protein
MANSRRNPQHVARSQTPRRSLRYTTSQQARQLRQQAVQQNANALEVHTSPSRHRPFSFLTPESQSMMDIQSEPSISIGKTISSKFSYIYRRCYFTQESQPPITTCLPAFISVYLPFSFAASFSWILHCCRMPIMSCPALD